MLFNNFLPFLVFALESLRPSCLDCMIDSNYDASLAGLEFLEMGAHGYGFSHLLAALLRVERVDIEVKFLQLVQKVGLLQSFADSCKLISA